MKSLRESAMDFLARREHSRLELERKLRNKGYADDEISMALDALVRDDLLSDERFAESFVRSRQQNGYGPRYVAQELKQRGVNAEIIDATIRGASPGWRDSLRYIIAKKFREPAQDFKELQKRKRYLINRGFEINHEDIHTE